MLKNVCQIESKIENWESHWTLSHDTPIHICKEMLFQFQKYIGAVEDAAKAQQEKENSINLETPSLEGETHE